MFSASSRTMSELVSMDATVSEMHNLNLAPLERGTTVCVEFAIVYSLLIMQACTKQRTGRPVMVTIAI